MSRKGHQINEKIKSKLKNESITELTYLELYNSIKNDFYPDLDTNKYKYSFIRYLNGFLNSGEIEISGYVVDKKRKKEQSFNPDHVILKWSKRKTRPEILNLLNEMGENKNSYQDVRQLFKHRIKDLDKFYIERFSLLEKEIISITLNEFKNIISSLPSYPFAKEFVSNLLPKVKEDFIKWNQLDDSIGDDVADAIMDSLDEFRNRITEKEVMDERLTFEFKYYLFNLVYAISYIELFEPFESLTNNEDTVFIYQTTPYSFNNDFCHEIKDNSNIEVSIKTGENQIPEILYGILESQIRIYPPQWSKTSFLSIENFNFPEDSVECPDCHFEQLIDIIYTYPNEEQKILMSILARGLADEPGSIRIFAEFFKKMSSINYPQRLNNILGIVSENPKNYYDKYKDLKDDLGRVMKLQQMKDE